MLWVGAKTVGGYGKIYNDGKLLLAHRAAWALENGPVPKDKLCLHTCDVRSCCNVQHLYIGTFADNHRDALERGRRDTSKVPRGVDHYRAKLTPRKVAAIRAASAKGVVGLRLAEKYGVASATIYALLDGRTWK